MKLIHTIFLIQGKPSKKSKITYRIRNGRQQCYILNHSTPDSPKQRACQSVFAQASAIINRMMAIPAQKTYWENIAALANIPNLTARKAAYAHYSKNLKPKYTFTKTSKPQHIHTTPHPIHIVKLVTYTIIQNYFNLQIKSKTANPHKHLIAQHRHLLDLNKGNTLQLLKT